MQEEKEKILEAGSFYFLNQQFKMAIKIYKKGLKLYEDDKDILFNLGVVYESINNFESAKECFKKVLEKDDSHKQAMRHLEKIIKT
ncbi:MAG: tetratricopeptide repeat protein [bacterium]|nr:tetratricopeptide repeat protein [bacterium]